MSQPFRQDRSLDPQLWEAGEALKAGDRRRAATLYQAVLRANPNAAEAHHGLGRILMRAGQLQPARGHLTRARALQPTNAAILRSFAELLVASSDATGALAAYEQLRELAPGVADAHVEAAYLYDSLGDPAKARSVLLPALGLDPDHPRGVTLHIKLALEAPDKPDRAKLEGFRTRLERFTGESNDPTIRAVAFRLLGQINDRLADYDGAFAAYTGCNTVDATSEHTPPAHMREGYLKAVGEMVEVITPERAQRWAAERPKDGLPAPAFIVGFPGSGTTLIERALDAHPGLVALDEVPTIEHAKALLFRLPIRKPIRSRHIAELVDALEPDQVGALRREYWTRARQSAGRHPADALVLDKMPLRIADLPFVNRVFPEARVIVAIRDPRDVCLSCYIKRFGSNIPMSFFLDLHDTARLYGRVMGGWLRTREMYTFPWMPLRYEDVVADFPSRAEEVLAFLGLCWDDAVISYHDTTKAQPQRAATATFNYHSVRRGVDASAAGRWKRYERHLAPILPTLRPFVEAFGYAEGGG